MTLDHAAATGPRQLPSHEVHELTLRRTKYCVLLVVWNEGDRLRDQLRRMQPFASDADIVIADRRSSDGSTDLHELRTSHVRTLLVTDEPGLSTATRMGLAYVLDEGYEGVITIDGNGKDGVEAIPEFLRALSSGYGLVQGSRFRRGGSCENTPWDRYLGVRFVMSPILSLGSRFLYTDPTNAFRAISREVLEDPRLQPFRAEFVRFNLQLYLIYQAARLGYRVKEIPVHRDYPPDGTVPTKITSLRLKIINMWEMLRVAVGSYNPRRS